VLITVSGMVGSGKTTAVREIVAFAQTQGLDARAHRFQSLPCITFRPAARRHQSSTAGAREAAPAPLRWSGYARKRLGVIAVAVFVARIVAFRAYRRMAWKPTEWHVLNRYFYDSLCHYQLQSRLERASAALLRALIPRPDLAIVVTAGLETIRARRPGYAVEYIELVNECYRRLSTDFSNIIELSTEPGEPAVERLTALLRTHLR